MSGVEECSAEEVPVIMMSKAEEEEEGAFPVEVKQVSSLMEEEPMELQDPESPPPFDPNETDFIIEHEGVSDSTTKGETTKEKPSSKGGYKVTWTDQLVADYFSVALSLKEKFEGPKTSRGQLYSEMVAALAQLGHKITTTDVSQKWRNLKGTFYRVHEQKMRHEDKEVKWPYYSMVHEILTTVNDAMLRKIDRHATGRLTVNPKSQLPAKVVVIGNTPISSNVSVSDIKRIEKEKAVDNLWRSIIFTPHSSQLSPRMKIKQRTMKKKIERLKERRAYCDEERNSLLKSMADSMESVTQDIHKKSDVFSYLISAISNNVTEP